MPAKHTISSDTKIIYTEWQGDVSETEIIEALLAYQENFLNIPDYQGYNEIFNVTKAGKINLSPECVMNIGKIASSKDKLDVKSKVAFIVNSNLAFGLARMYGAYRSFSATSNKEIQVFKKESEALEWVNNG